MGAKLSKRLVQSRGRAGFREATAAARHFGWAIPTYLAHENGSRGFGLEAGRKYAIAFKVDVSWLLTGRGRPAADDKVPIQGYVGTRGIIYLAKDIKGPTPVGQVDLPPGDYDDYAIFRIRGTFYYPAYRDNELIFARRNSRPPAEHLARDCVVRTDDGRTFLRTVASASDGGFVLLGFNDAAPVEANLTWAWPVVWSWRQ